MIIRNYEVEDKIVEFLTVIENMNKDNETKEGIKNNKTIFFILNILIKILLIIEFFNKKDKIK